MGLLSLHFILVKVSERSKENENEIEKSEWLGEKDGHPSPSYSGVSEFRLWTIIITPFPVFHSFRCSVT